MCHNQYAINTSKKEMQTKCKQICNKSICIQHNTQLVTWISNANQIPNKHAITSNSKMQTKSLTSMQGTGIQNLESFEDQWGLYANFPAQRDKIFHTLCLKKFSSPKLKFCFVICQWSLLCSHSIMVQLNIPHSINLNNMCWFSISHSLHCNIGLGSGKVRFIRKTT